MKNKSFAVQYALREIRVRRRALYPVFCIAFGVVLLMNSLMIFMESEYRSDLAYYRVRTQFIMENLDSADTARLRQLEYVKSAEPVENGATYICFVELEDEYCSDYGTYARSGVRIMEDLGLKNREPYKNYWHRYQEFGLSGSSFLNCGLFNYRYMNELKNNPIRSGPMLFIIFLSCLMHLASMTLVFGMKIRRSRQEYAAMRGMGAPMKLLRQINRIEAVGITLVMYIPAFLVSAAGMRLVSWLSEFIYAGYGLNSVLHFHIPWAAAGLALLSYILAAYLAVFFCTKSLQTRTVAELTKGSDMKIPFVEKSSAKYVNCPDFSLYGRTESHRNRKNLMPTRVLFAALIGFPILMVSACVSSWLYTGGTRETDIPGTHVYSFYSDITSAGSWSVPKSLADLLTELDGITGLEDFREFGTTPFRSPKVSGLPKLHSESSLYAEFHYRSKLTDDREIPAFGTCIAPAEFYQVGDAITLTVNDRRCSLTVSGTGNDCIREVKVGDHTYYEADFTVSEETVADIMGWEEMRYSRLNIFCEKGRETEMTSLIEKTAGLSGDYVNDYDRQIHQLRLIDFTGSAVFLERRIADIRDTFLILFLLTEAGYLLICAGAVIYSVTSYEVDGRTREFAILRALGLDGESLMTMAVRRQVVGIAVMTAIAYIGLTVMSALTDESVRIYQVPGSNQWVFEGMDKLLAYFICIGITCVIALIGYGICARQASVKTVREVLEKPIAENVKNTD